MADEFLPEQDPELDNGADDQQDEAGIHSSQVLDICNHMISESWKMLFNSDKKELTLDELHSILDLASNAHATAMDVLLSGLKIREGLQDSEDQDGYNDEDWNEDSK